MDSAINNRGETSNNRDLTMNNGDGKLVCLKVEDLPPIYGSPNMENDFPNNHVSG